MVTGLPVAVEALAVAPHDVHPQERARHGIEAGGQHENVQVLSITILKSPINQLN